MPVSRSPARCWSLLAVAVACVCTPGRAAGQEDDGPKLTRVRILRMGLDRYIVAYERAWRSQIRSVDEEACLAYAKHREADNDVRMKRLSSRDQEVQRGVGEGLGHWESSGIRVGWVIVGGGTRGRSAAMRSEATRADLLGQLIGDVAKARSASRPGLGRRLSRAFERASVLVARAKRAMAKVGRGWPKEAEEYAAGRLALMRAARGLPFRAQTRLARYMSKAMDDAEEYGLWPGR